MIIEEHAKYKRMENKAYYEKNKSFILENKKKYYELPDIEKGLSYL